MNREIKFFNREKGIKLTIAKDEIRLKLPFMDNKTRENIIKFVKHIAVHINGVPTMRGNIHATDNILYVKLHNDSNSISKDFNLDLNNVNS